MGGLTKQTRVASAGSRGPATGTWRGRRGKTRFRARTPGLRVVRVKGIRQFRALR